MNGNDLLDAIGMVDEDLVQQAKEKQVEKQKKKLWRFYGAMVACVAGIGVAALQSGMWFSKVSNEADMDNKREEIHCTDAALGSEEAGWGTAEIATEDIKLVEECIVIYVVDDEKLIEKKVAIVATIQNIFQAWKEENFIGEEVQLLFIEKESNEVVSSSEFMGEIVITYESATYQKIQLTVSKALAQYYETINESLLLKSLEMTMVEALGYDDCCILLQ